MKFFHLTRADAGWQHHVALASGFVPKKGEHESLQFRRATGRIPLSRGHTCLCSRHHVKEQSLFFKIIYFIERQIKQHQYYKLCATHVFREDVHHLSCYSATLSNFFPATIKSKCASRISECYLSTSSQKKPENLTNGKTLIPWSYPVKSKTEYLTGQTVKPFFPVLPSKIQTEVRIVRSHLQIDASGQFWPNAPGGGCHTLPTVHRNIGQHVLPLLVRGASLIGLKATQRQQ